MVKSPLPKKSTSVFAFDWFSDPPAYYNFSYVTKTLLFNIGVILYRCANIKLHEENEDLK